MGILIYFLASLLTPIVKTLVISVEQGRGGNNIKYNQTLNFLFSVLMSLKLDTRSDTEFTVRKSTVFCDVKNWVAISLADPLNALAHSLRPHIEPI